MPDLIDINILNLPEFRIPTWVPYALIFLLCHLIVYLEACREMKQILRRFYRHRSIPSRPLNLSETRRSLRRFWHPYREVRVLRRIRLHALQQADALAPMTCPIWRQGESGKASADSPQLSTMLDIGKRVRRLESAKRRLCRLLYGRSPWRADAYADSYCENDWRAPNFDQLVEIGRGWESQPS